VELIKPGFYELALAVNDKVKKIGPFLRILLTKRRTMCPKKFRSWISNGEKIGEKQKRL